MPRAKRTPPANDDAPPVQTYRYDEKRPNIPPAGLAAQGKIAERPKVQYSYDPHLPPVLRFDATGRADGIPLLLEKARHEKLSADEVALLAEALRQHQPWLEWTGKREQRGFDVDPVALHMHERVAAEAILAVARREDVQRSLFADPEFEYHQAVKFYEHPMDWTNRLILGDSLSVMNSLAVRENLAGRVQMIYIDPPYEINFKSNFQPFVNNREVKDREQDLTREPEQVKAYRDTWTLGVHSYLTYLRDRLLVATTLLRDTGSVFVQIGDKNVHRVRLLLDSVFHARNFVAQIAVKKTGGMGEQLMDGVCDYLLWYAKDIVRVKYYPFFIDKTLGIGSGERYSRVELSTGEIRPITESEEANPSRIPDGAKAFLGSPLTSQTPSESTLFEFTLQGRRLKPRKGGWKTNAAGMHRLVRAERLLLTREFVNFKMFINDFAATSLGNMWTDTMGTAEQNKMYVVQTAPKVVARCILMTTDPGDLVLDPTCGGGTTAYVAEQWGRRWITIDTSRVAIALARQRLLTAKFDYYAKEKPDEALHPERNRFVYKTVPHVTLKSIAQNLALDPVFERWEPQLAERLAALNTALAEVTPALRFALQAKLAAKEKAEGKSSITEADRRRWLLPHEAWQEWEVPFDTDPDWPPALRSALEEYRRIWRGKMDEVNATIAASAPNETLVDQPEVVRGVVRVSGPFSVEGLQPGEERLDLDSPIGGEPDPLGTFGGDGEVVTANADAYLSNMIRLLAKDGVRFPDNQEVKFDRLEPLPISILHAAGEWTAGEATRRVAVAIGPQYGPITAKQVEDSLWTASRNGYDELIFAGFTFDAAAQAAIQEDPNPRVRCHMAYIRPDVNMGGLLKETPNSQLFTVFGLPRVRAEQNRDGEWTVEMEGVDIYDPASNSVVATRAEKVAAWFLDGDYDGRTFCITQAFFPDRDAWDKLARALKTVVDPDRFASFSGTKSLPFRSGTHKRAAVKVIDPRGNEVLRLVDLDSEVRYE